MSNKLEPMIQAKIKKDIDSATGGDLSNYYTKTESDAKFALKTTVDTLANDVDTLEDTLTDYVKSVRFKLAGTGSPYESISVPANNVFDVDLTPSITANMPTGYKLIAEGAVFVESMNTIDVIPLYSFYYADKNQLRLRNINATVTATITNMWVSIIIRRI